MTIPPAASRWQRAREVMVRNVPAGFYNRLSWQYVASLTTVGVGFVYALVVARALGPAEFGLMSLGLGFATIVFQVVELRLQEAVIRYVAEFWEAQDAARTLAALKLFLIANVGTGLLAFVLVLGAGGWAEEHLLRDVRGQSVLLLAALTVLFTNMATATAYGVYRVFGEFRLQAIITSVGAVVKLAITSAVLFGLRWDVIGVMGVGMAASLGTTALLLGFALRIVARKIDLKNTPAPLSVLAERRTEIRKFVTSTYVLSLTMIPTKDLDLNLLGLFVPLQVVGVYKIAKSFMSAVWTISDPIFLVVYPELARLWTRRAMDEMRGFVKRITAVVGVSALLAYLGACIVVPIVIVQLMGEEFAGAGSLFRLMTWGLVFWAPFVWVNPLLLAAGRPDLVLKASLVGGILTLLIYFVAIPRWGAAGAAFVTALVNPIVLVLSLRIGIGAGIVPSFRGRPA